MMQKELLQKFEQWIIAEGFQAEDKLPGELELAERFHVSRSTIREIIIHLSFLGVLERTTKRGTFIRKPDCLDIGETLAFQLHIAGYGFEELKQTRLFLETSQVSLLLKRITPGMVDRLNEIIVEMESCAANPEKADQLDMHFHLTLMEITGNRILKIFGQLLILMFDKKYKVTIPAGKSIMSDALPFPLKALQRLSITINYTSAPTVPTVHMGSRTTSYIMKGVTNAHSNFEKAFRENHWYNISGIDVYSMRTDLGSIAIMGNSITDGKCSTDNAQNRWPDVMSEMLQLKHKITNQGVLNLGIGNNRVVVPGGFGTLAKDRFDRDILGQFGVKKVIIFEGINDIGAARSGNSETVARQLIESYQAMIKKAKARKMKVYLATITPFKGAGYYSPFHEAARQTVNEWIRSQGKKKEVDGVLDFAKLLQSPEDDRQMKKEYASSDWLHPNPTGYKAMGTYAADIIK